MPSLPNRDEWLEWDGIQRAQWPELAAPRRRVWLASRFSDQLLEMDDWPPDRDRDETPRAQVEVILQRYAGGRRRLYEGWDYKRLRTSPVHVYELRTRDVRIFGFLLGRGEFCAVLAKRKSELGNRQSYEAPISSVVDFVRNLRIPGPKFSKGEIDDIFEP